MDERLAAADAALKAGRRDDAIALLAAAIEADPATGSPTYRVLVTQLYLAKRFEEGVTWSEAGTKRYPRDLDLWNLQGVCLRNLRRYPESLAAFDQAARLGPGNVHVQTNRGNVLLDMDQGARAEPVFTSLIRKDPRNAEYVRQLGRALFKQGKLPAALSRFRQAVALQKTLVEGWMDLISATLEQGRLAEGEAVAEKALAANPDNPRLIESRVVAMRRAGEYRRAEAYLLELLPRLGTAAWIHYQLGATVADYDRDRCNAFMRKAVELEPNALDYVLGLVESLERTRTGDEGANIEESYQLARHAMTLNPTGPGQLKILNEVLIRVCAYDELATLGDFATLGRFWASSGRHTALLKQLARVETLEDRYELLEQHRIWGRMIDERTARQPIRKPKPRPKDGRVRLGFLSSDLRAHPVGYFAQPLFDHVDPRFDLYCYSFYQGAEDAMQKYFASKSKAYRWDPEISTQAAAQMIADDQLDILIELGGTTHMNRLELMAYRLVPKQASWLGYPHSAGVEAIDYLITDPYNTPPRRDLLLETPLMMPKTWIALGRTIFSDAHAIAPATPQDRQGVISFGTANNPHKYTRGLFGLWARTMHAVPGSRFVFVRPEGSSPTFRKNILSEFERGGIAAERVVFHTIRGAHMPFYNEIDISLDTAPLTGGTTTTESLWMGVPVVSLVGEAFFERLSASILANSGLADLATPDPDEFVRIAAALAADKPRRESLRRTLRDQIRSGPLGQTQQFATDFYDLIARTVEGA